MTPVDQQHLHTPTTPGDCYSAVLATLLDLPLSAVPYFAAQHQHSPHAFYDAVETYLASQGYAVYYHATPAPGEYHILSGTSPRDPTLHHAVVARDGIIVHDPHPSRAGLSGDPRQWSPSILVRLLP